MNSEDLIGIIELGNINIKCLIFKIRHLIFILPSSIIPIESSEFITLLLSYHLSLNQ